jgi:hypothetical protein
LRALISRSASATSAGVGGSLRAAATACTSDCTQARPRWAWRATASVARFLYCTKPHRSAMPHASTTTPPNDSSIFAPSDKGVATARTGMR